MKRKPTKRKIVRQPKQAPIVPVEDYDAIDKSHPDTIFIRVGDVMVPTQLFKKIPLRTPLALTNASGLEIRSEGVYRIEMGKRLPFVGVSVPEEIGDEIDKEGYRRFCQWRDDHISSALRELMLRDNELNIAVCDVLFRLRWAVEAGFYMAILRFADDLKNVPEAAAILGRMKNGRKKGAATTKRKAEPRKMEIRRRFRALRKSGFNKGDVREEIQQEYRSKGEEISVRQIERYTEGLS